MSAGILIDSHIFLWLLSAPQRLSSRSREMLSDASVMRCISTGSLWELGMKFKKGKLSYSPAQLQEGIRRLQLTPLDVTYAHVLALDSFLGLSHRDPFDLMLVTQAFHENLTLYTADKAMLSLNLKFVADATK